MFQLLMMPLWLMKVFLPNCVNLSTMNPLLTPSWPHFSAKLWLFLLAEKQTRFEKLSMFLNANQFIFLSLLDARVPEN